MPLSDTQVGYRLLHTGRYALAAHILCETQPQPNPNSPKSTQGYIQYNNFYLLTTI